MLCESQKAHECGSGVWRESVFVFSAHEKTSEFRESDDDIKHCASKTVDKKPVYTCLVVLLCGTFFYLATGLLY